VAIAPDPERYGWKDLSTLLPFSLYLHPRETASNRQTLWKIGVCAATRFKLDCHRTSAACCWPCRGTRRKRPAECRK
jgi:hypothetical protein